MKRKKINVKKIIGIALISLLIIGYIGITEFRFRVLTYSINQMSTHTVNIISALMEQILKQSEIVKEFDKIIDNKIEAEIQEKENLKQNALIELQEKLKLVNVVIYNDTAQSQGSGVTLKYNNKYYILSAGHMINDTEFDTLHFEENNQYISGLEVVKVDWDNDLVLLKPKNEKIVPRYYTELTDNEPLISEEIYVVGNPMGLEDFFSDGRVQKYSKQFMYISDNIYYGSSGGGAFNKAGKLIGIVSHFIESKPNPNTHSFVIYGIVRLKVIKEFLKGIE